MSAAHTPGPWRVATDNAVAGPEDGFNPIGACGCCDSPWMMADDKATQEADARLIAAAPDLLDTLVFVSTDPCFSFLGSVTQDEVRAAWT